MHTAGVGGKRGVERKKKALTPSSQGDFDCRERLNGESISIGGKRSLCVLVCEDYEAGHIRSLNLTLGQAERRFLAEDLR